jgi:hypothetical protein
MKSYRFEASVNLAKRQVLQPKDGTEHIPKGCQKLLAALLC